MRVRRFLAGIAVVGAATTMIAAPAFADPSGAKNAFTVNAMCDNGQTVQVVTNSANGQGSGAMNNNTAEFAPAHIIGTNQIFHPVAFDLSFTFTPANGPSETFTDMSSRPHQSATTTCDISGSQTSPQGTFSISGEVAGWIS